MAMERDVNNQPSYAQMLAEAGNLSDLQRQATDLSLLATLSATCSEAHLLLLNAGIASGYYLGGNSNYRIGADVVLAREAVAQLLTNADDDQEDEGTAATSLAEEGSVTVEVAARTAWLAGWLITEYVLRGERVPTYLLREIEQHLDHLINNI